jgi:CheY-like chemotaxis protein/anti-sigma regulatory factor (Ser/Thr protein kinase)
MTTGSVDLLLVEDNQSDAQFIQRILTEFRPVGERILELESITHAESLAEVAELLETDPDVALLDLNLPGSNGIETVELFVDQAPHIPVVVATGRTEPELGPRAIKAGAQDYLTKGRITAELLLRTLRYAIDRQQKQLEIVELNRRLALLNRIVRQDVRSDVAVIVGRGAELRTRLDGDNERIADALVDAARRIVDRTDTASELLSVLSTGGNLEVEPLDISELIDRQTTRLRGDSNVDLTTQLSTDEALSVQASPLLEWALEQLLLNATEHNDNDHPRVVVSVEPAPEEVVITVSDNGWGIPDAQRALLNDPNGRYHTRSGIRTGLYFTMTVVELSEGTIHFADNESGGTAVTVTVPRVESD